MSSPSIPQPLQRLERLVDLCDSVLDGEQPRRALHLRFVWPARGVFYPRCCCGWLGSPCLQIEDAWSCACEVEMLLVDSAERARRILRG